MFVRQFASCSHEPGLRLQARRVDTCASRSREILVHGHTRSAFTKGASNWRSVTIMHYVSEKCHVASYVCRMPGQTVQQAPHDPEKQSH